MFAILQNAIQHSLPLSLNFLDMKNATFGLVSHDLNIGYVCTRQTPSRNPCLHLKFFSAYMPLKTAWSTPKVSDLQGGVPRSYSLHTHLFGYIQSYDRSCPVIVNLWPPIQDPLSNNFPKANPYQYTLWDKENSDELKGWHPTRVTSFYHGSVTLLCLIIEWLN